MLDGRFFSGYQMIIFEISAYSIMIKTTPLISLLCLLTVSSVVGQDARLDSLEKALQTTETDTSKINILVDLAYGSSSDPSQQLTYAQQAYEIGRRVESNKQKSRPELV